MLVTTVSTSGIYVYGSVPQFINNRDLPPGDVDNRVAGLLVLDEILREAVKELETKHV